MQIVPGFENHVAIDLISTHIRRQLHDRSKRFRDRMVSILPSISHNAAPLEDDIKRLRLYVLSQTPQLKVRNDMTRYHCIDIIIVIGHLYYLKRQEH